MSAIQSIPIPSDSQGSTFSFSSQEKLFSSSIEDSPESGSESSRVSSVSFEEPDNKWSIDINENSLRLISPSNSSCGSSPPLYSHILDTELNNNSTPILFRSSSSSSSSSSSLSSSSLSSSLKSDNSIPTSDSSPLLIPALAPVSHEEFQSVLQDVKAAIQANAHPIRIGQGSSGSYFCRNLDGQIVGVFKPKDEEPYGDMNPKWTKWIHRNFFCCCFGRSCLVPNVGFLSEAGASLLDQRLGFGLVPRTEVVSISSSSFYYPSSQRKKNDFRSKIGSFQLYLRGFQDASLFLKIHPLPSLPPMQNTSLLSKPPSSSPKLNTKHGSPSYTAISQDSNSILNSPTFSPVIQVEEYCGIWDQPTFLSFLDQFQRLTILDYIMRNTDRGLDNWMIKYQNGRIQIAAIDHGLAFPYKHPDKWRSYPYGWLYLKIAHYPFLASIRKYMHTLFSDPHWWSGTRTALHDLFRLDPNCEEELIEAQMSVMRGQVYNLYHCLVSSPAASPMDLWFRPPIIVVRQPRHPSSFPSSHPSTSLSSSSSSSSSSLFNHHCVDIDGHHCLGELNDDDLLLLEDDLENLVDVSHVSSMKGQVKAIWQKGKRKMRDGSHQLLNRARNVILEATKKPWFRHW